ncbi:MAG: PorP/SprF family type IX secretion system membrane protein, partial [Bacteroidetes bacterium]|nr:PorP/SprF family type IX secretion system membrane protein [Bacteroidota bacterium]
MKRILLLFIVVALCGQRAYSQQDPKYTHYMFNQVVYNPGFIGVENGDNICINLVYRNQWLGFDPSSGDGSIAPITTTLTLHTPIKLPNTKNKLGVGLVVSSDRIGFMNDVWAHANVNYIYQLGPKSDGRTISGGLTMGIMQKAITPSFEAVNGSDPILTAIGGN